MEFSYGIKLTNEREEEEMRESSGDLTISLWFY